MNSFTIHSDGASRGNPGPASIGFTIIKKGQNALIKGKKYIGISTNNVAEYQALNQALNTLIERFSSHLPARVKVLLDSQLIVEQLLGNYKVKDPRLKILYDQIKLLEKKIGEITYQHIPRSENQVADKLANEALDEQRYA